MTNKDKWTIAAVAGIGAAVVAGVTYSLLAADKPEGAKVVQPFDIHRYLGKWNEIARMPSRIEKNLYHLTELYSEDDNGYKVVTKGYNIKKKEWKEALGRIKFAGAKNIGALKVSYLGPFYLSYNVLDIDPNYQHALVSGSGLDHLWILSRLPAISDDIKKQFLDTAVAIGFDVNKLEWM